MTDDIENYLTRYTDRDDPPPDPLCLGCGYRDCECDHPLDLPVCVGCGRPVGAGVCGCTPPARPADEFEVLYRDQGEAGA